MPEEPFAVSLSYADGESISMLCQGAVIYASDPPGRHFAAVAGRLTLGDAAQLMTELIETFGAEDVALAFGLALVARRLQTEE